MTISKIQHKKYQVILYSLCGVLSLSCSSEIDLPADNYVSKPLEIVVHSTPVSKSLIEGNYLPDNAELGVFIRATDGGRYDGLTLNDVRYTATGTEGSQVWNANGLRTITLTQTNGTAYAFYPWVENDYSDMLIPITNDETDWMYSKQPVTNLTVAQPVAQFELVHAMSIIRCRFVKGDYYPAGVITTVGCTSNGLAKAGTIHLQSGTVSDYVSKGDEIVKKAVGTVGEDGLTVDLWAVPTGETSMIQFRVIVDGTLYHVTSENLTIEPGMIYNFSMVLNNETLSIANVSYENWSEAPEEHFEAGLSDPWSEARQIDGVYAIDVQGNPVPYAEATDDTYQGVAFVVRGKAYQVAHQDAIGPDGTNAVYWCLENYKDIPELKNYNIQFNNTTVGTINVTSLPENPAQWTVGAVSDFEGEQNTSIILKSQTTGDVINDNTIAKSLSEFCEDPLLNQGYIDWFIPSQGELAAIAKNRIQLNTLLQKANGNKFSGYYYLSSTESSYRSVFTIYVNSGVLNIQYKFNPYCCRFIRLL